MTDRVKCVDCANMILPQTAANNNGLCGQCVKISPEIRAAGNEYKRRLAEGLVFVPSDQERSTACIPKEIHCGEWKPQPEYYAESDIDTALTAISTAKDESAGYVFLVTEGSGQLNLSFNQTYGVCEYRNEATGELCIAYSQSNLKEQVSAELHVIQACPCCGVEMLWYPSRFHMPRDTAFLIIENAIAQQTTEGIEWLEADDISYTEAGRG